MSSVDDRIVNMQFNNQQFEAGAAQSSKTLNDLNQTLANTAKGPGLSTMSKGVEDVKAHFSALQVAGVSAIATIASKATTMGIGLIKSFTIDPFKQGFGEYQTQLDSIQTIMANTGASIKTVGGYLDDLNHYSDQTIYDFGQMASAIGKFTAAGVPLKEATSAIKGMANSAALSGASIDQLNNAMYQVSQALASGTIRLMDWNSLVNANMGGMNMQKSLEATAKSMKDGGVAMTAATAKAGNFRDSLQSGWLTADIFNKTMKIMAGTTDKATGTTIAFSVAQLKAMGYTEESAKQLHKLSGAAIDSATKIKTIPQMLDVIKEAIGSGWAKLFQDFFGNFNQSVKMWTKVGLTIQGTIGKIFGGVDAMLMGWRKLGGYQELWAGFGNIFKTIGNLIHPFLAAFQALSPGTSKAGSSLEKLTHGFQSVTGWMVIVSAKFDAITPVLIKMAEGVKYLFGLIGKLIDVAKELAPVLTAVGKAAKGMIEQGINIGQGIIDGILQGIDASGLEQKIVAFANGIVDWFKRTLGIHSPATELVPVGLNVVAGIATGITHGIVLVIKSLGTVIAAIFHEVGKLFAGFTAMDWASLFNTLLTGGLLVTMNKIGHSMSNVMNSLSQTINNLGGSLQTFQNSIRAKMIMDIAIAVALLTASIVALSFLKPKQIEVGLGAIASMMATLTGAMFAIGKSKSAMGASASILLISTALLSLTGSVAALGSLSLKTVAQGIGSISAILAVLTGTLMALSKIPPGSIEGVAASMLLMAVAMNVLVTAVLAFGHMDMKTLAKGLGAMAIGLALMAGSLIVMSGNADGVLAASAAMVLMATALNMLVTVVLAFGHMDLKTLAKGFIAMGVALLLMVGSLLLLSGNSVGVLAAGAAMVLMATALNILLSVILVLGAAPWQVVARGLGFVAAALAIFLLAGLGAQYVAAGLEVLGTSILLLGVGMLAAGLGMSLFATGLAVLATVGSAATGVLVAAISAFINLIPSIAEAIAGGVVAFLKVLANASGQIRTAMDKIFRNVIGVISDNIKPISKLISKLIAAIINVVEGYYGDIAKAVLKLINTILGAIDKNITSIINKGTDIIVKLIQGMGKSTERVITAMGDTMLAFLEWLDAAVQKYIPEFQKVGASIAYHIVNGMAGGLPGKIAGLLGIGGSSSIPGVGTTSSGGFGKSDVTTGRSKLGRASSFSAAPQTDPIAVSWGKMIGDSLTKGIYTSMKKVVGAAIEVINASIAAGNSLIAKAETQDTKKQIAADKAQAKSDIIAKQAKADAKFAQQHQKDKAAQKKANLSQHLADKQQNAADKAQAKADAAAQKVSDAQTFASSDTQGKGDIKQALAKTLSDNATKLLAKANAEAAAARKLQGKARTDMLKAAKRDAKDAQKIADRAKETQHQADKFYGESVDQRVKQMQHDRAADEKATKDQAKYDAATDQGKADIMTNRAAADQKTADAANAKAKALIAEAKKLSKTDAKKAQKLLDKADAETQIATDAASSAKDEADQAQQLKDQISGGTNSDGTITPPTIVISRSVLEDAASSVDRYSKSLHQAEVAAGNDQPIIQFQQYNTSPEALTPSTIYRQTKNLLSTKEIKMG